MFQEIAYYQLLSSDQVVISENWLQVADSHWGPYRPTPERILEHPYFCIVPGAFKRYSAWIDEKEDLKSHGISTNDHIWAQEFEEEMPLIPMEQLKPAEELPGEFSIVERFDTRELLLFWFGQNHFNDPDQWKKLGLTNKLFNLLPANSNYYDRSLICTCGQAGCDNQEVWYIKHPESYRIPFIIGLDTRLVFDLHHLDLESGHYDGFSFCFESKNFDLFKKTLFANGEAISEYGKRERVV
ncbi:MAG TPA: hypothetical protein VG890_01945 [Puia sp.]|nr:hypothetical protein [Puia sp.]